MHCHKPLTSLSSCFASALLGCCLLAPAWSDSDLASNSTSLEVIVKFSDDSDTAQRVDRILEEHPMDLSELAVSMEDLHRSTGFLLIPERISSGREVILRIPEKPLLKKVEQTVAKRTDVAAAELVAIQSDNPRLPELQLLLHFHPSSDESALLENAYGDSANGERVQTLAAKLCADSGVPVIGTPQAGAALAVTVDRYALLEQLLARLHALDDVDYAQPNSTLQFMK